MKQWIGGLLATVIGGILLYLFSNGIPAWLKGAPPTPQMGELEIRTNLDGGDIANFDKPTFNTAGECSNLCQSNNQCKAMTFVEHPGDKGGVCWLKDKVPARSASPNMTSAVKVYPK